MKKPRTIYRWMRRNAARVLARKENRQFNEFWRSTSLQINSKGKKK